MLLLAELAEALAIAGGGGGVPLAEVPAGGGAGPSPPPGAPAPMGARAGAALTVPPFAAGARSPLWLPDEGGRPSHWAAEEPPEK